MKKLWLSLLLSMLLPITTLSAADEVVLARIVAVVNDDVILDSELQTMVKLVRFEVALGQELDKRSGRPAQPTPSMQQLQGEALNRLLNRKLILQAGGQGYLHIAEQEIDDYLSNLGKRLKLSPEMLEQMLQRVGLSMKEYRDDIEAQIISQRIAGSLLGPRVAVSQQEVDNYMASQVSQGNLKLEYQLSIIYIAQGDATNSRDFEEKRKQAESILKKLQQGADFASLAKQYSNHDSAIKGGYLDWRSNSSLPEVLSTALLRMNPGDTSGIIQGSDGFYIIKLHASRNNQNLTRADVENSLVERKFSEQYGLLILRLRNEAQIDIRI